MNEKSIKTMNIVGVVGKIVSIVAIVLDAVATLAIILALIAVVVLPKDLLEITTKVDVITKVNLGEKIYSNMTEQGRNDVVNGINEGKVITNGSEAGAYAYWEGQKLVIYAFGEGNTLQTNYIVRCLAAALASCVMLLIVCIFVMRLCNAFTVSDTPFSELVIKRMNALAISLIPWGVITWVSGIIAQSVSSDRVNINMGINISYILAVVLLFGLVQIFKYGAKLQQQADETL